MKTLTLVPLGSVWINPEEIAAIATDYFDTDRTVITLRSNQVSVVLKDITADEVVERLQKHFGPSYDIPQEVAGAVEIAQLLAPHYPNYAPTTVASAVEQLVETLTKNPAP
jgi:protoheme ferro-lyase